MSQSIEIVRQGAVAWLWLNRPDAMNALTVEMLERMDAALTELSADQSCRVLVIAGRGRAFCAGVDLKSFAAQKTPDQAIDTRQLLETVQSVFANVRNFPKPVIVAISGTAVAGGLELALNGDIVVAAESARLGDGHLNVGILPGAGGATLLPRLVGPSTAKLMLLTGDLVSAETLCRAGLIAKVYQDSELEEGAALLASRIAEKSPLGTALVKKLVDSSFGATIEQGLAREIEANEELLNTHDRKEGMAAFAEKRKPAFLGR